MTRWAAAKRVLTRQPERVWSWAILGCVLLFVAAIRFRLRDMPLERDEGEFAYAGQLLLQGVLPGRLVYTMKLPGTHVAYALLMALFGQSCAGVHLGFLVVNCATIVLVFLLARALFGALAGPVAAAGYGLMSLSADVLGSAAHATHFVVLFALTGLLLLWHASKTGRLAAYFGSGFLLSSSVLMKHNGLLFVAFGTAWLVWLGCSRQLGPKQSSLKAGPVFLAGLAAPFLCLLLVLWWAHTIESYWFWSVSYARAYSKPNPGLALTWRIMMQRLPAVLHLPFYAGLFGLAALWARRCSRQSALFATGLLVSSLLAVVAGFHFRPHYYVLLIPALALLTGALVQEGVDLIGSGRFKFLAAVPVLLLAFLFAEGIVRERNFFFRLTPIEASRSLYGTDLFPAALELANYLRAHSQPDARIAILGSEPEIYFYSRRRSATGYIYTYPLMERQPFALQMQRQMAQEVESAQPQFIIQVRTWISWLSHPGSPQRIREMCEALTPAQYRLIGAGDFSPKDSRVAWHWRLDALKTNPSSELLVFERQSGDEASGAVDHP